MSSRYKDPYRGMLPDTGEIKFTHGDLHRGNIIVSSAAPARILAIVDWAQAGWYRDYWEYCKALYTCWYEDGGSTTFMPTNARIYGIYRLHDGNRICVNEKIDIATGILECA